MVEFALLILGNSPGMMIANLASIILMGMLSWFVFENCWLPERIRLELFETTLMIPNVFILQLYLFLCAIAIVVM